MRLNQQWPNDVPPWPESFPPVMSHCSLPTLYGSARQTGEQLIDGCSRAYLSAKSGDMDAAIEVVHAVLDINKMIELLEQFPDCVVAAVHAEEVSGRNKLPAAYANAISEMCDMEVDEEIVQINRVHHTNATARQRLARVPLFGGSVTPDRAFIITDDVCTTGSSLASLRHYIEARGSHVVIATTLALPDPQYGLDPHQLAIRRETIDQIQAKFDLKLIDDILQDHGIAPSIQHLTESAGQTILRFNDAHALRSSLAAPR